MNTALIILTLINSVMLTLNIAFTNAIDNTVDRIELYMESLIKEGKKNKNSTLDPKLYTICRQAFKSGNTHANMKTAYNEEVTAEND